MQYNAFIIIVTRRRFVFGLLLALGLVVGVSVVNAVGDNIVVVAVVALRFVGDVLNTTTAAVVMLN